MTDLSIPPLGYLPPFYCAIDGEAVGFCSAATWHPADRSFDNQQLPPITAQYYAGSTAKEPDNVRYLLLPYPLLRLIWQRMLPLTARHGGGGYYADMLLQLQRERPFVFRWLAFDGSPMPNSPAVAAVPWLEVEHHYLTGMPVPYERDVLPELYLLPPAACEVLEAIELNELPIGWYTTSRARIQPQVATLQLVLNEERCTRKGE